MSDEDDFIEIHFWIKFSLSLSLSRFTTCFNFCFCNFSVHFLPPLSFNDSRFNFRFRIGKNLLWCGETTSVHLFSLLLFDLFISFHLWLILFGKQTSVPLLISIDKTQISKKEFLPSSSAIFTTPFLRFKMNRAN